MGSQAVKTEKRKGTPVLENDGKNLPVAPGSRKGSAPATVSSQAPALRGVHAPVVSEAGLTVENDWRKTAVAAALLMLAVGLVGYAVMMPSEETRATAAKVKQKEAERIEQLVNKHLVMTNTKIEIEQRKKDLELKERLHSLGNTVHERPVQPSPVGVGVDMSPDRHELNAINDLRGPSENLNYHSPGNEIMRELADSQQRKAEEEAYNKAYREAVVAEARRQGFELTFAPDGRILKATPIRGGPTPGTGYSSK